MIVVMRTVPLVIMKITMAADSSSGYATGGFVTIPVRNVFFRGS